MNKSNKFMRILILALVAAFCGCDKKPQSEVGRFQIVIRTEQGSKTSVAYLLDTANGRIWASGSSRQVDYGTNTTITIGAFEPAFAP